MVMLLVVVMIIILMRMKMIMIITTISIMKIIIMKMRRISNHRLPISPPCRSAILLFSRSCHIPLPHPSFLLSELDNHLGASARAKIKNYSQGGGISIIR